ncbi:hypothetical protein D9M70_423210 [compost metagenome]
MTDAQAQQVQNSINERLAAIDQLNSNTSTADTNFDNYKNSIGYTGRFNQLTQANSDANQRQAQIDAIYKNDPYLNEHQSESDQQSQLQNQLLSLQQNLGALQNLSPELAQALGQQMAGLLIVQKSLEDDASTIANQEQAVLDAKSSGAPEATLTALQEQLDSARTAYEASNAYTQRTTINGSSDLSAAISALTSAIQANDANAANTALQQISGNLNLGSLPSSVDVPTLLARDETGKANTLSAQASSQQSLVQLAQQLETERLALVAQSSSLQLELNDLAAQPYDTSSNLLTSDQLADAISKDTTPPLTAFDAYEYLRQQARDIALSRIPTLRSEINALYQQLSPGDSYTVNSALLNSSSGWFVRFPQGEKVLSASVSFQGAVLFSTFSPNGQTVTTCGPDVGSGRFYAMSLIDASAVFTKNINGTETPSRSFNLIRGGIPPSPAVILGDGGATVLVGSEKPSGSGGDDLKCTFTSSGFCKANNAVSGTYWREN